MKVLEPGRPQTGWAVEERCTGHGNGGGGCDALLLIELADLYRTYSHSYDGSRESFFTFTCAACQVETDFVRPVGHLQSRIPDKKQHPLYSG